MTSRLKKILDKRYVTIEEFDDANEGRFETEDYIFERLDEIEDSIDKKIEDCNNDYNNPNSRAAKYKLMRLKNEMTKKLMRVAGGKNWYKQI